MYRTAESVTPKHPDKICDRISDAVLDACLETDPDTRAAIEVMGGHGIITITGELRTTAYVNIHEIARRVSEGKYGVQVNVVTQSPEIALGVDIGGAGDQGIMVGYANNHNEQQIPNELYYSRSLAKFLYERFPEDGKTQITLHGGDEIETIVASFANVKQDKLRESVIEWYHGIKPNRDFPINIFCNPAGDWQISGFEADTGVTGRKLACDNYGTSVPIGGGAFSGKDCTKVDRSGAYMARFLACYILGKLYPQEDEIGNIEILVKLAYAIGLPYPVMATVHCRKVSDNQWVNIDARDLFDGAILTPGKIAEFLELKKPQFEKVAEWGSFGNGFKWDRMKNESL